MLNLYTIHDRKGKSCSPPFVASNHLDAARKVKASLNSDSMLLRFPEDYALYFVGRFDPDSGLVEGETSLLVSEVSSLVGGA